MSSQNILKSFSFSHFHMKSSPGVGGLDADEGAGDHLDVAKQGGHPNNDNLRRLKMVTFLVATMIMMTVVVVWKRRRLMMLIKMKKGPFHSSMQCVI